MPHLFHCGLAARRDSVDYISSFMKTASRHPFEAAGPLPLFCADIVEETASGHRGTWLAYLTR